MRESIAAYLSYLKHEVNAAEATIAHYGDDLRNYYAYCVQRLGEEVSPSAKDLDLVRGWLSGLMDSGLKASSVSRYLSSVKGLYRYLLKCSRIERNPVSGLRPPRREKPLPVYVPTKEIEAILADTPEDHDLRGIRDRAIIATLYECGLRRSELATLCDADVDLVNRSLKVRGKGNKERIIPFGLGLAEILKQWRQIRLSTFGCSKSFFLTLRGKEMTGQGVYAVVHRVLQSVPNLSRRGAHALRHSFATDMLNAGADLMAIKELMGHSKVSTTVGYTHTSFKQLQQMYNAHPRAQKEE